MKEAYFERAAAYFELGQFNLSIEDFLTSGFRVRQIESPTQLGLGISAGILHGMATSATEFVPSMLSTLRGLGCGLWAFAKNPLDVSQEFVHAAVQCVEYIKSHSSIELVQTLVPELKELIQNYDTLNDHERGTLIGQVIGKYGMDILLAKEATVLVRAYAELKRANRVMTLKALANPETTQVITAEATKCWTSREQVLKNGNLKIHADRQGKHIEGHRNYHNLLKEDQKPSIFIHSDPERLIRDYAGTGIKDANTLPGMPGYREIVDFGEFIGYHVNRHTGEKTATTLGKIHYAKDGVHIVPYIKKGQ